MLPTFVQSCSTKGIKLFIGVLWPSEWYHLFSIKNSSEFSLRVTYHNLSYFRFGCIEAVHYPPFVITGLYSFIFLTPFFYCKLNLIAHIKHISITYGKKKIKIQHVCTTVKENLKNSSLGQFKAVLYVTQDADGLNMCLICTEMCAKKSSKVQNKATAIVKQDRIRL